MFTKQELDLMVFALGFLQGNLSADAEIEDMAQESLGNPPGSLDREKQIEQLIEKLKMLPAGADLPLALFNDLNERGNIWLTADGDHNAWFRMDAGRWLEMTLRLDNYPGLNIAIITITDEKLAEHIKKKCGGMYVRKMNLEGVRVERNAVVGEDDDVEEESAEEEDNA